MSEFLRSPRIKLANSSVCWHGMDTKERWLSNKSSRYTEHDIIYKFNNYGYRCDDFTDHSNHKLRVLFAGGSDTEGVGLKIEETWSHMLHTKIKQFLGYESPYWSIAQGGTGIDATVRALYHFHDMLRPHLVIVMLPDPSRREPYHDEAWGIWCDPIEIFTDPRYIAYQTEKNLAMIDLILAKHSSQMLALSVEGHYSGDFDASYDLSHIHQFVVTSNTLLDTARDNLHPGPQSNAQLSNKIFDSCREHIERLAQQC